MKAGRKLDAIIAEKVMGWMHDETTEFLRDQMARQVPHYSTNIGDAWKVLEYLKETRKLSYDILAHADPMGNFIITFWNRNMAEDEVMPYDCVVRGDVGDTLSHVICLAALRAVGYKGETMKFKENPKVINYIHHDEPVSVVGEFQGQHKEICICHQGCIKFSPGWENNCPMAEMSFQLSKVAGLVLVMECDEYEWNGTSEDC